MRDKAETGDSPADQSDKELLEWFETIRRLVDDSGIAPSEKDSLLLRARLIERELAERQGLVRQQEEQLKQKEEQLRQRERQLVHKDQQLKHKENFIDDIFNSLSWRVTKPLRALHSAFSRLPVARPAATKIPCADPARLDHLYLTDPLIAAAREQRNVRAYDVLVYPIIDWHFRIQRPQHLSRQLAALRHRVFYLSSEFSSEYDVPGFRVLESPEQNIFIVQLVCSSPMPESIYRDFITPGQQQFLLQSLAKLCSVCNLEQPVAIVDLPFWRPLAEALPGAVVVYDCMDHHAGFSTNNRRMLKEEDKLLSVADLVVTSSLRLSEFVAKKRANLLIRNGAEVVFFSQRPDDAALRGNRPVVGYFGAIADWFDMELVIAAAKTYSDWDFILVGATSGCETRPARSLPNITFVGEVSYSELPAYLHCFNVCIIPFRITELTRCTNPVKVYEYLSAGRPVVATAMPELQLMGDYVHVADSHQEFIAKLKIAMAESGDEALARSRMAWAAQHDWRERAAALEAGIAPLFPPVSVIVLTYNNIDLTRMCLESLMGLTCYPDWELIIVDNASSDGTQEYLRAFAEQHDCVHLILNERNLGFAGGNNVGLAAARGEYLVLLNNDTQVTRGWLTGLVRHLRNDNTLGLVGPVTNNIANEAMIAISYRDMTEMQDKALAYTARHSRRLQPVDNIAFFCVALRSALWERIGGLDEAFSIGFFEDDDYCRRVRGEGLKVAIANDVFIHHHHSAGFNTFTPEERDEIFASNRRLFEQKWGAWLPHKTNR